MSGHNIAYLCAKFDYCSFSRSGDVIGAHKNFNGSRDLTTPDFMLFRFFRFFVTHGLALAMINLPTKFEVSISAHYEDM